MKPSIQESSRNSRALLRHLESRADMTYFQWVWKGGPRRQLIHWRFLCVCGWTRKPHPGSCHQTGLPKGGLSGKCAVQSLCLSSSLSQQMSYSAALWEAVNSPGSVRLALAWCSSFPHDTHLVSAATKDGIFSLMGVLRSWWIQFPPNKRQSWALCCSSSSTLSTSRKRKFFPAFFSPRLSKSIPFHWGSALDVTCLWLGSISVGRMANTLKPWGWLSSTI